VIGISDIGVVALSSGNQAEFMSFDAARARWLEYFTHLDGIHLDWPD